MDTNQSQEWEVLERKISRYSNKKVLIIKFRKGLSVTLGVSEFQDYDELLANAKIIVVAPKLLQALLIADTLLRTICLETPVDSPRFKQIQKDRFVVIEAIKQATS